MGDTRQLSWTCACGRHVPLRVNVCHCGATREAALPASTPSPQERPIAARPSGRSAAAAVWSTMPTDVRAMALASVFILVAGLGWAVFAPTKVGSTPALLGWVDPGPHPTAKPKPPPRPPFKLPWWK